MLTSSSYNVGSIHANCGLIGDGESKFSRSIIKPFVEIFIEINNNLSPSIPISGIANFDLNCMRF